MRSVAFLIIQITEECVNQAKGACSSSSLNPAYIIFYSSRQVKVDNHPYVLAVQSSSCNISCYKNWNPSRAKLIQHIIPRTLSFVTMSSSSSKLVG
ncbi:hypothetical protein C1H46_026497 [Malus baccata]|uniref:Uncharacterized protein n=1 Tax=Malus baccata TaxID=106549 RepID=A0A540LN79_MALBA|nr:hypothetical protein C1H46_026497 [Malus baccata]